MLIRFLLFIMLLTNFSFSQQNCSLEYKGIVLDKHDLQPVPFAKIYLKEVSKGFVSDTLGKFSFVNLCAGNYQVSCLHHVGCAPEKFEINLQKNLVDTIFIEYHLQDLDEIVIQRYLFELSSQSTLRPNEIEKKFGLGKSLADQLKQLPGVSSMSTGNSISKPIIHGMHSNRVLVLNNGIRQEGQQWGSEHAPEIDPFLSTDISIVKGANAIKYGSDAIAGVILTAPESIEGLTGLKGKVQSTFFTNGRAIGLSGALEGDLFKIKNFSWRLQGTWRKGGTIHTPNYYLKNTALEERNFSFNTFYRFKKWKVSFFYSQINTSLGIFSGAHIGNLTDLIKAFEAKVPNEVGSFTYEVGRPKQKIEHELTKVQNEFILSKNLNLQVVYARQFNRRQEFDKHMKSSDTINGQDKAAFKFNLTTHQTDVFLEHSLNKKWKTTLGSSYIYQENTYEGSFFIPNFKKNSYGLYLIEGVQLKKHHFEAGLRADKIDLSVFMNEYGVVNNYKHDFSNLSASLGYHILFGHHLLFRINFANAWRAPQVNELYSNGLHHGAAAIEVGNRNLGIEKSLQVQTGITYKSNKFNAQVDAYLNDMKNFIYLKPSLTPQLTIKGAFPEFRTEAINALFYGLDFFVSYNFTKASQLYLKGALVRAKNTDLNRFIVGIPSDRFEPGINFKKSIKSKNELNFSLQTPIITKQTRFEQNEDYVDPPKGYFLVNMVATYTFNIKKQTLDFSVEISNLLNTSYRDYLNRFRYYADEMGRTIGFKLVLPFKIK